MVDRDREYSRIRFFELSGSFTWGKVQNPDATSFRARGDDEPRHKPHNCHTEPNITDHGKTTVSSCWPDYKYRCLLFVVLEM